MLAQAVIGYSSRRPHLLKAIPQMAKHEHFVGRRNVPTN